MKKLTATILTVTLLLTALFCIGIFTASATDIACTESDCTGSYTNGICSADPTHYQPAVQAGVGTNGQPLFEISNAGQLFWFAGHVNTGGDNEKANAILKADIDLNVGYTFTFIPDTGLVEVRYNGQAIAYLGTGIKGDASGENTTFDGTASYNGEIYANADDGLSGPIELLSGIKVWSPIGINQYAGNFNGNGKTVSGLYIRLSNRSQGLFGQNYGTVKHIGVINSCIISYEYYIGGVVGYNRGDVTGCYHTGVIGGSGSYVGGVVGYNNGDIEGCHNTGPVSINGVNVGGIAGYSGGNVTGSYNTGAINGGDGNCIGGVVGYNGGDINNSYNKGNLSSGDNGNNIGGVAGYSYGDVTNSYNKGNISIGDNGNTIGGVVGHNGGDVNNSYNAGAVSGGNGSSIIGGVMGQNGGNVSDSYNVGNVSVGNNSNNVGGVAGISHNKVRNSYNKGNVSSGDHSEYVGGVVGYNYNGIRNSYNVGNVSGGDNSNSFGGVVGYNTDNVRNSYNKGNVSAGNNSNRVGGVVGYNTSSVANSYNTGAISGGDNSYDIGSVVGYAQEGGNAFFVNTYYLAGTAACGIGNAPDNVFLAVAKTESEFKNGTVAWLLNDYIGYGVFGQTLAGEQADASPVFLTEHNRIYFGYTTCDAAETAPVYTNISTATAQKPTHDMAAATCTAPSTCSVCGHTEGEALGHKMAAATCTAPSTCSVCGHTEGETLEHSYDNACDTACNTCGAERAVGEHLDSDGNSLCDHCVAELPREGLPTGAIIGIVLGATALLGGGGFCLYWFVIKKRK